MTKNDFLNGLKNALANDLENSKVQAHVNYYNDYINDEMRNGRSESDVIAELGDPWAIAKTILLSEDTGAGNYEDYSEVSSKRENRQGGQRERIHVFGLDTWWKKLLLILGIVGVIMIIVTVIGGIVSLIVPFIIPIIIITFVLKMFRRR